MEELQVKTGDELHLTPEKRYKLSYEIVQDRHGIAYNIGGVGFSSFPTTIWEDVKLLSKRIWKEVLCGKETSAGDIPKRDE